MSSETREQSLPKQLLWLQAALPSSGGCEGQPGVNAVPVLVKLIQPSSREVTEPNKC